MGLHRDATNRKLGGVCSGLGKYFLVGGTFFRILFFVGTFLSLGIMLLIYLFLWIILSKKESWYDDVGFEFDDLSNGVDDEEIQAKTKTAKAKDEKNEKAEEEWDQDHYF